MWVFGTGMTGTGRKVVHRRRVTTFLLSDKEQSVGALPYWFSCELSNMCVLVHDIMLSGVEYKNKAQFLIRGIG